MLHINRLSGLRRRVLHIHRLCGLRRRVNVSRVLHIICICMDTSTRQIGVYRGQEPVGMVSYFVSAEQI